MHLMILLGPLASPPQTATIPRRFAGKTKAARRRGFGEPLSEFRKSKEDKEGIAAHKHKGDARAVRGTAPCDCCRLPRVCVLTRPII